MKKQILFLPILILALVFTGCSDDDPAPVIEQEVITTVVVTLTGADSATFGTEYVMRWEDPDYAVGEIMPGYSGDESIPEGAYNGDIQLYNNTLPEDDEEYTITYEILEEGEGGSIDHQFFFSGLGGLVVDSLAYLDLDNPGEGETAPCGENNPIGQQFSMVAVSGMGELGVLLIHEPEKCADGMSDGIWNGVGEEDVDLQFPLTVDMN